MSNYTQANINQAFIPLAFLSALVSTGCSQPRVANPPKLENTQTNKPDERNDKHDLNCIDQKLNLNATFITNKQNINEKNDSCSTNVVSPHQSVVDTNMSNSSSDGTPRVMRDNLSAIAKDTYDMYLKVEKSLNKCESQWNCIQGNIKQPKGQDFVSSINVVIEVAKREAASASAEAEAAKHQAIKARNKRDKDVEQIEQFVQDAVTKSKSIQEIYQKMLQLQEKIIKSGTIKNK